MSKGCVGAGSSYVPAAEALPTSPSTYYLGVVIDPYNKLNLPNQPANRLELVKLVTKLAGAPGQALPEPELVPEDPGKVRLTSGGAFNIAHAAAEKAIGWKPLVGMEEGIRRLIAWREGNEPAV